MVQFLDWEGLRGRGLTGDLDSIGMNWNGLEWVGMNWNNIKGDFDRNINRI